VAREEPRRARRPPRWCWGRAARRQTEGTAREQRRQSDSAQRGQNQKRKRGEHCRSVLLVACVINPPPPPSPLPLLLPDSCTVGAGCVGHAYLLEEGGDGAKEGTKVSRLLGKREAAQHGGAMLISEGHVKRVHQAHLCTCEAEEREREKGGRRGGKGGEEEGRARSERG